MTSAEASTAFDPALRPPARPSAASSAAVTPPLSAASPAVWARGLRKRYGDGAARVDALLGVDLCVPRGEIVGILGPNGAGKTTLIEILEGLRQADAGEARVLGISVADRTAMKQGRIGISFQQSVLPPLLTVHELLQFQHSLFSRSPVDVAELIGAVGLADKRDARIGDLSGGQQQRVTVALALVGDPELMFLDEPTSQLDPQARRAIWAALEQQRQRRDAAILLTTHQMEEAQRLCGHVVLLDGGRVIADGSPAALIDRYRPGRVVEFATRAAAALDFIADPLTRGPAGAGTGFERVRVEAADVNALIAELLTRQRRGELAVDDLRVERQTLEDVFLGLTGRRIRD